MDIKKSKLIIDYLDYEKLESVIKRQQAEIDKFKKGSRVILYRESYCAPPEIICDETLAKEFLKTRLDNIVKRFNEILLSYNLSYNTSMRTLEKVAGDINSPDKIVTLFGYSLIKD